MEEKIKKEKADEGYILFSPIGNTDPIRHSRDGACLHIVRHYKPVLVYLFLTKAMVQKEKEEGRYTLPIKRVAPGTEIKLIETNIDKPHDYDSLIDELPRAFYNVREEHPNRKILMNMSSGTPQMKSIVDILALQDPLCTVVQVTDPERGESRDSYDHSSVNDLMNNNLDDEPGVSSRCLEPRLLVLRYYDDKSRIEALIDRYDYDAAWAIAKRESFDAPPTAKKLIEHAANRLWLKTDKARQILKNYKDGDRNVNLFPFGGDEQKEELVEYFLTMQIDGKIEHYANYALKLTPFLDELLRVYLKNIAGLKGLWERRNGHRELNRNKAEEQLPGVWKYLDDKYGGCFNGDISARSLIHICRYASEQSPAKNADGQDNISQWLKPFDDLVFTARNSVAHRIESLKDDDIERLKPTVNALANILAVCCKRDVGAIRSMYDSINKWIKKELKR